MLAQQTSWAFFLRQQNTKKTPTLSKGLFTDPIFRPQHRLPAPKRRPQQRPHHVLRRNLVYRHEQPRETQLRIGPELDQLWGPRGGQSQGKPPGGRRCPHLPKSASNLITTVENGQARGEREREALTRSIDAIKQRQDGLEDANRALASRVKTLEEANEKLRADLTKIEKIRMGLEGPQPEKKE